MANHPWVTEFPGVVTLCDAEGTIIEMNDQSIDFFEEDGGASLIGTNVLDCHPEPSRSKLTHMMESGTNNIYTIEKDGKKKLVYQTPWYRDGKYAGFVEMILDIPDPIPHHD